MYLGGSPRPARQSSCCWQSCHGPMYWMWAVSKTLDHTQFDNSWTAKCASPVHNGTQLCILVHYSKEDNVKNNIWNHGHHITLTRLVPPNLICYWPGEVHKVPQGNSHFLKNVEMILEWNMMTVKCKDKYQLQIYLSTSESFVPTAGFPQLQGWCVPTSLGSAPKP